MGKGIRDKNKPPNSSTGNGEGMDKGEKTSHHLNPALHICLPLMALNPPRALAPGTLRACHIPADEGERTEVFKELCFPSRAADGGREGKKGGEWSGGKGRGGEGGRRGRRRGEINGVWGEGGYEGGWDVGRGGSVIWGGKEEREGKKGKGVGFGEGREGGKQMER